MSLMVLYNPVDRYRRPISVTREPTPTDREESPYYRLRNGSMIRELPTRDENPLRGAGYMDYVRSIYQYEPYEPSEIMPTFSPEQIRRIIDTMNEKSKPKEYKINTEEIQSTMDMIAVFRYLVTKVNPTLTEHDVKKFGLEQYVHEK